MSLAAIQLAMEQACPTPGAKVVLIALADFHNGQNGECFPSNEALIQKTGLGHNTITRGLKALRMAGLIDWKRTNRTNAYRLLFTQEGQSGSPILSNPVHPSDIKKEQSGSPILGDSVRPLNGHAENREGTGKEQGIEEHALPLKFDEGVGVKAEAAVQADAEAILQGQTPGREIADPLTLEQAKSLAARSMIPEPIAELWFHSIAARNFCDRDGNPIKKFSHALAAYWGNYRANPKNAEQVAAMLKPAKPAAATQEPEPTVEEWHRAWRETKETEPPDEVWDELNFYVKQNLRTQVQKNRANESKR